MADPDQALGASAALAPSRDPLIRQRSGRERQLRPQTTAAPNPVARCVLPSILSIKSAPSSITIIHHLEPLLSNQGKDSTYTSSSSAASNLLRLIHTLQNLFARGLTAFFSSLLFHCSFHCQTYIFCPKSSPTCGITHIANPSPLKYPHFQSPIIY